MHPSAVTQTIWVDLVWRYYCNRGLQQDVRSMWESCNRHRPAARLADSRVVQNWLLLRLSGPPEPPETAVDGSLTLARFPSELLLHLAEELGNPLVLLVSRAHLSKAFHAAARAALAILTHIDLRACMWTVNDAVCGLIVGLHVLSALVAQPVWRRRLRRWP